MSDEQSSSKGKEPLDSSLDNSLDNKAFIYGHIDTRRIAPNFPSKSQVLESPNATYSDHAPLITTVEVADHKINLLTLNTLGIGNGKFGQNLYPDNQDETKVQGEARYARIVAFLAKAIKENQTDVICLQEVTTSDMVGRLKTQFPEWGMEILEGKMITLYKKNTFKTISESKFDNYNNIITTDFELRQADDKESIKFRLHNVWTPFDLDNHEQLFQDLVAKQPKEYKASVIIGDTNKRVAPIDNIKKNIITGLIPGQFMPLYGLSQDIHLYDFPDGAFVSVDGNISQLPTIQLDFETGKLLSDEQTSVNIMEEAIVSNIEQTKAYYEALLTPDNDINLTEQQRINILTWVYEYFGDAFFNKKTLIEKGGNTAKKFLDKHITITNLLKLEGLGISDFLQRIETNMYNAYSRPLRILNLAMEFKAMAATAKDEFQQEFPGNNILKQVSIAANIKNEKFIVYGLHNDSDAKAIVNKAQTIGLHTELQRGNMGNIIARNVYVPENDTQQFLNIYHKKQIIERIQPEIERLKARESSKIGCFFFKPDVKIDVLNNLINAIETAPDDVDNIVTIIEKWRNKKAQYIRSDIKQKYKSEDLEYSAGIEAKSNAEILDQNLFVFSFLDSKTKSLQFVDDLIDELKSSNSYKSKLQI